MHNSQIDLDTFSIQVDDDCIYQEPCSVIDNYMDITDLVDLD